MKFSETLDEKQLYKYEQALEVYYKQTIGYFDQIYARVSRYGRKQVPLSKWPTHLKEKYRFIELVVASAGAGVVTAQ